MHQPPPPLVLPRLRRVRWIVRLTLVLGVAASVAANVLHARPDPVAQIIAAWPPLALLLTVELISRVPVGQRGLAAVRLLATTTIAGIAAWVSYWHMAGVAARYGEDGASPYLLPLSVDGLVIVASVSLVELASRIRTADTGSDTRTPAVAFRGAGLTPIGVPTPTGPDIGAPHTGADHQQADESSVTAAPYTADPAEPTGALPDTAPEGQKPGSPTASRPDDHADTPTAPPPTPPQDEPPADLRDAVAYWHAKDPALRPGDIAARVGRSRSTVRRILAERAGTDQATGGQANGDGSVVGVNGSASNLADSHPTF